MKSFEIPKLKYPQCSVIKAELSTGHILTITGEIYLNNSNAKYALIFISFEEAKGFCEKGVKANHAVEYCIYDHLAEFVEVIRH